MSYTEKFQTMADQAIANVESVLASEVNTLIENGAIALDIRDKEEHVDNHIEGSMNISRGKLEMIIEKKIPDLNTTILCYCNFDNRGALSANSLKGMGYINAKYIKGGLTAYRKVTSL